MKRVKRWIVVRTSQGKKLSEIEVVDLIPQSKSEIKFAADVRKQIQGKDYYQGGDKLLGYEPGIIDRGPDRGRAVYPLARNGAVRAISPQALVIVANSVHQSPQRIGDPCLAGLMADVGAGWTEQRDAATLLHLLSKDRRRELVASSRRAEAVDMFVACLESAFDNHTFSCEDCLVFSKRGGREVSVLLPDRRSMFPFGRKLAPEKANGVERLIITAGTFDDILSSCMQHSAYLHEME